MTVMKEFPIVEMGSNYGLDRDFSSDRVKVRMGFVSDLEVVTGGFLDNRRQERERKLECQSWLQGFWCWEKVGVKDSTNRAKGMGCFVFMFSNCK